MKKSFFSLTALLLFALSFTACKKDEKTFEEKVTGEWHSVNVRINGQDVTDYFMLDIELEADNSFDATLKIVNVISGQTGVSKPKGEWTADDSSQEIELIYDGTNETELYEVIEVSESEMMIRTKQNNDDIEIKFEKV